MALRLLARYPDPWRARYEAEVRALIHDVPVRWRDVAELFRGLLAERARELMSSDDRPRRTIALLTLLKLGFAFLVVGGSAGAGWLLHAGLGPWTESARTAGQLVLLGAICIAGPVVLYYGRRKPYTLGAPYEAWVGAVMLPCLSIAIAVSVWGDLMNNDRPADSPLAWVGTFMDWYWWIILVTFASNLASSLWPTHRMLAAFNTLQAAEAHITSYEQLAASCREWIAKGVPSPLADAEAEIGHWTRIRDQARDELHALGYRARFKGR